MGLISSKEKQSTIEILDGIEKQLTTIAHEKFTLLSTQKQIVGYIVIFLILGFFVSLFYLYIYYWPSSFNEAIFNLWPLLLFPLFLYILKYGVQAYFDWCLTTTSEREKELERTRKEILDKVKENENYKTAMEILERYDPVAKLKRQERERRLQEEEERQLHQERLRLQRENEILRYRTNVETLQRRVTPPARMPLPTQQPALPIAPILQPQTPLQLPQHTPHQPLFARANRPITPRVVEAPLLPAERSPIDKIVDYLLGDGPSNRYALICSQCHSHNGMALPIDFEYIAFRCPYCQHFNPSKKQRDPPRNAIPWPTPRDRSASPSLSRSESNCSRTHSSAGHIDHTNNSSEESSHRPGSRSEITDEMKNTVEK